MIDFHETAINAKVAGILVQGNGSDVFKGAEIADEVSGILVVTMMQDSTDSRGYLCRRQTITNSGRPRAGSFKARYG